MDATDAHRTSLDAEIRELGLEKYVLELEVDGLTVVPPEVHGVELARFDEMSAWILRRSEEVVGCPFDLDTGPLAELDWAGTRDALAEMSGARGEPSQFIIQQLARHHRLFRDLAVNPVAVALMRHLIGTKATRLSSTHAFVKWQGDFGYGPHLGMHTDQTAMPLPWGRNALTSNTNWVLTDYTREGGAFAYVPGSHRRGTRPVFPDAVARARPVEVPKGSVIVFHGATWHGAYPRTIPGMRLMVANYYRHYMVMPQEDISGSFPLDVVDDCDDPATFRRLAGFSDVFPYRTPFERAPRVRSAV